MSTWLAVSMRSSSAQHADLDAVVDAALDQRLAVERQRLPGRIANLAGQAEAAGRIAVRAGIALHEDAVENRLSSG